MRGVLRILVLLAFVSPLAHATTYFVSPGANLQSVFTGTTTGDTVSFSAGRYSISGPLTLKCGVSYTGPVATPATAVLDGSGSSVGSSNGLFTLNSGAGLANPCTQATAIQYFAFSGVNTGIYVQTSFTNLTIAHNQFISIPGRTSQTAAIVFQSGTTTSNTASILTNTIVTQNQFGDANSCISPTNVMADTDSPEDYEGACNGMVFFTSINGLTVTYNNFLHVAEGAHINCPNYANQQYPCEPPGGALTQNITVRYNDFSQIHRITWEEQPQQASGIDFEFNSEHDWVSPYFGAFGLSMACCYNGTSPPALSGSNNVVLFNTTGHYGYAMEAMGHLSLYNNVLAQANATGNSSGLAYGCGPVQSMSNNTVQGGFNPYIFNESGDSFPCGTDTTPAQLTGNVTGPTAQSYQSAAPSASPASGTYASPLLVTLTDTGFSTGSLPLGNTSIWYTTDGTTPVPGSGTAKLYTGSFPLNLPAAVKAVGMWGAPNQPTSYASGFGFVPSVVVTASYVASGTSVTLSSIALSCPSTALTAGAAAENCSLQCNYSDSSHDDCTNAADPHGNGPGIYSSSQPAFASITSGAVVTPLAAGTTNLTAQLGVLTSTLPVSVTASGGGGTSGAVLLGNNQENFTGFTSEGYFNSVYSISPPYATTVSNCHFFLPTGTVTSGKQYDCLIIAAPTASTEASTPICHGTYTTTSTVAPNAFVSVPVTGCGTLAASTSYWVATNTNDPSGPSFGFWNCGSTCTGSAPTTYGTGTYSSFWAAMAYGTYTGFPGSMSANTYQVSQYVDLTPTAPALTGGYQDNTLSISQMIVGGGYQQHAYCVYSDGVINPCDTTDARGNTVTAWTEDSSGAVLNIGAVGSGSPGLVTGVGYGQASSHCTLTGGIVCNKYIWTVTNQPATSFAIQGMTLRGMNVN